MRIISGKFRGKIIPSPKQEVVKPTLDRVKENIFNIIQFRVPKCTMLDLFCGSGAIGLEFLSRGAEFVTFVDSNKANISSLEKFLKQLNLSNYELKSTDYYEALKTDRKYDIIFLDPPYDSNLAELAIQKIYKFGLLKEGGIIIWEHSKEKDTNSFKHKIFDTRTYGSVVIDFLQKEQTTC